MNLDDPRDNLRAFVKARASLEPTDTVVRFAGDVWAEQPGGKFAPLFGVDGYNVARAVESDGGYDLLTREAGFYLDVRTRRPLERWTNPFTNEEVDVVHIWNDPVNQRFRLQGERGPWRAPYVELGDDVLFKIDVPLAYPSPLPRAQFPDNSQDDLYVAVEMFGFATTRSKLDDNSQTAPCTVSWTRLAPWLPFMRMADRPGRLIYHCNGAKLAGGYGELPEWMRALVEEKGPRFARAPETFTEPNETSWTYFRRLAGVS